MTRTRVPHTCPHCGSDFDLYNDEIVSEADGTDLCDDCYCTTRHFTCAWCEECGEIEDRETYLVVFEPAHVDLALPGLYRIDTLPYYWSAMLSGGIHPWAVTWLGALPTLEADPDGYPWGHLCADCQQRALAEVAWATACGIVATRARFDVLP